MSPSTPSSCANAPIIRSFAWCSWRCPATTSDDAVLVDPLADGLSLEPLYELFRDTGVVKVFHAARQDLEIFFVEGGVIPEPLFDTQVAAMVCGFGEQVGYETLVRKIAQAAARQDLALHRLVAPAADRCAEDLCAGRCDASAGDLRISRRRAGEVRPARKWVEEELADPDRPGDLRDRSPTRPGSGSRRGPIRGKFLAIVRELARFREDLCADPQRAAHPGLQGRCAAGTGLDQADDRCRIWAARGCCCARRGAARSPTASWRR